MKGTTIGLLCVAAILFAACGGDDDNGGDGQDSTFAADADSICREAAVERREVDERIGALESDEDAIELVESVRPIEQDAIEQLRALEVPEDLAADFDESLELREQADEFAAEAVAAAESGNTERFGEIAMERRQLLDEAREIAAGIGLQECGGVLPEEAEASISETIEQSATGAENDCTELYTEAYIEATFSGDVEACNAEGASAETVDLSEVSGIDGVSARAVATLGGGQSDGQAFDVTLVAEDGTWKIDTINAVAEEEPGS